MFLVVLRFLSAIGLVTSNNSRQMTKKKLPFFQEYLGNGWYHHITLSSKILHLRPHATIIIPLSSPMPPRNTTRDQVHSVNRRNNPRKRIFRDRKTVTKYHPRVRRDRNRGLWTPTRQWLIAVGKDDLAVRPDSCCCCPASDGDTAERYGCSWCEVEVLV